MICLFSPLSTLNRRRRARLQALPRRVCSAFSPTLRPAVKRRWSRVQVRAILIAQELVIRTTLHYPWSLGGRCQTYRAFMACDARRYGSLKSPKKHLLTITLVQVLRTSTGRMLATPSSTRTMQWKLSNITRTGRRHSGCQTIFRWDRIHLKQALSARPFSEPPRNQWKHERDPGWLACWSE